MQDFRTAHDEASLRLEVVTLGGERIDTLQLAAVETVPRLSTRDDRLVFLPYPHIAYIDVSVMRDHRVAGFSALGEVRPASHARSERGRTARLGSHIESDLT